MTMSFHQPRKAWMAPVPCTTRLQAFLRGIGINLYVDSLARLALKLTELVKPGDAQAAQEALRTLRRHLRQEGHSVSLHHARQALATYLGTLDWKERLRQMTQAPEPVTVTERTPVSWFRENGQIWARFAYQIVGKKEGLPLTPDKLGHPWSRHMRMRFLTRARPAHNGLVRTWGEQQQGLPPVLAAKARQREDFYYQLTKEPLSGIVTGFEFTHYVIAEVEVQDRLDGFEGDYILQRKLRNMHAGILGTDNLAGGVRLVPVTPDEVAGYEDLQSIPTGQVEQWPGTSRGWRTLADKCEPFEAFVDLDVRRGAGADERDITCYRYGLVRPFKKSPARPLPRSVFGGFFKSPAQPWQAVLSGAPVFEAFHAATSGLLVTQSGGSVTRYAPWTGDRSFMVDEGPREAVSALTSELAAQAKAEGLGVCMVNHEPHHTRWFQGLAPDGIVQLDSTSPMSLNPLSGIQSAEELEELLPSLCQILYELVTIQEYSANEALASCIRRAWKLHGEKLEISHIANQFRPFGKPAERALQAALDHLVERADSWLAGPCSVNVFSQDLCLDVAGVKDEYTRPFPLAGIVHRLVMALVYRRALGLRGRRQVTQLTLLVANDDMNLSHQFCASLMNHCRTLGTCLGFLPRSSMVGIYDLSVVFEDKRSSMPVLIPGLAQDSHRAYEHILWPEEFKRLPTSHDLKQTQGISFAVIQHHQLQGYFTLELPEKSKSGN
jgi:hypothetical protein